MSFIHQGSSRFKKCDSHATREAPKKVLLPEHGKHIFDLFNTSAAKLPLFFGQNHRRGVSKMANCDSHAAWEAKKNKLLTEHGKQIFHFCNPSRLIFTFLAGFARFWPVLAGSGRFWPVRFPFWDLEVPVSPPPLAPGVKITWVTHKLPQTSTSLLDSTHICAYIYI